MKKTNTRTILLGLLVAASFGSYIFLHTASFDGKMYSTEVPSEQQVIEEEIESNSPEIYVPDVAVIKKMLETTRKFLTSDL